MSADDFFPPAASYGWLCPRCHAVNGPHVAQCSCQPQMVTTTMAGAGLVPEQGSFDDLVQRMQIEKARADAEEKLRKAYTP